MKFYWIKTNWLIKKIFVNYTWDVSKTENTVYLTFDDGPIPEITTWVLDELKKINSCIKEDIDTSIKLENRTLQESREIEIEKEERQNAINKSIYFDDRDIADHNEEIQQLDFYKRLNLAFKLMEIIGEIVKNYSGTLEGPTKSELIKLVYGIGLRSLKTFISLFEEHHEQLVSDIKHIIVKKNKVTADKINETVYGTIFGLASSISTKLIVSFFCCCFILDFLFAICSSAQFSSRALLR